MPNELERELETFSGRLDEMLATDMGKFALVKEAEVIYPFDTESDAISTGYRNFGNVPFLVKRITHFDRVLTFTRPLVFPDQDSESAAS